MLCDDDARRLLADGFAAIRQEFGLRQEFPDAALQEAAAAAARPLPVPSPDRIDARHLEFVTLDPASSTDLDQAFCIEPAGDDLLLHYAIADVGWFVPRNSALEAEAMLRGQTIYAPDGRIPQYPEVLCEGAASLLPDQDRPAILLDVTIDPEGNAALASAKRALVRSRAKLAYEHADATTLPPLLGELARRIAAAEDRRGAVRVELPQQEVVIDPTAPGGLRLAVRERVESEDVNSAMSLAANLAVADCMLAAGVGLFRVMARPDQHELTVLHHAARALGIDWPAGLDLGHLQQRLDPTDPRHRAFLGAARRAGGGASYAAVGCDPSAPVPEAGALAPTPPWHAAVAATYAHATAPLRRLADRYVLDLVVALHAGQLPGDAERAVLASLPAVMTRSGQVASKVESAALDLLESVSMKGREGDVFDAVVMDVDKNGARIQLADPPVVARLKADGLLAGSSISVRLDAADPALRRVTFSV